MIQQELIDILACPQCKGPVQLREDGLLCEKCMLLFSIEDDIPVMLMSEAKQVTQVKQAKD